MSDHPFAEGQPILASIRAAGLEPDQRFMDALRIASPAGRLTDSHLLLGLCRTNMSALRCIPTTIFNLPDPNAWDAIPNEPARPIEELTFNPVLANILNRAVARWKGRTLGSGAFVRAIVEDAMNRGEEYGLRGHAVDLLVQAYGFAMAAPLSSVPQVVRLIDVLNESIDGVEDYQYIMTVDDSGHMAFRVVSVLDDYVQAATDGSPTPLRALLTHIGRIGLFASDDVAELEDLINSRAARETEFQRFFEAHPHFLRRWDHREVYPHVYLQRSDEGPLIPDFIVTNTSTQDAMIVELKRAALRSRVVRQQENRVRFSDAIMEARARYAAKHHGRVITNFDEQRAVLAEAPLSYQRLVAKTYDRVTDSTDISRGAY